MNQTYDVICFSHLRWDFVFQRPQHLMTRFGRASRVFIIEEPENTSGESKLNISDRGSNIYVCTPHINGEAPPADRDAFVAGEVKRMIGEMSVDRYITWFYTPMMLPLAEGLDPVAVVYDCMDELSHFKGAPPELREREQKLFEMADVVFTGGHSLYGAKKQQHGNVHAFPSSIDVPHFGKARTERGGLVREWESGSQPIIGFVGVIDERMDVDLLGQVASLRPDWKFVVVGPVVKISEEDLPKNENIEYPGGKAYDELPSILAGWDVAFMPFALNDSTKYISPTKTPEFLAAGLPVVSTPITDVISPYGDSGHVSIVATAEEAVAAIEKALELDRESHFKGVDEYLSQISWDKTFDGMKERIAEAIDTRSGKGASDSSSESVATA